MLILKHNAYAVCANLELSVGHVCTVGCIFWPSYYYDIGHGIF